MREQGVTANATPHVIRGRNKGRTRDAIYRAQKHSVSTVVRQRVADVARELLLNQSFHDPARERLLETRKAVVRSWLDVANSLGLQGETTLAGNVRLFARDLPRVLTDKERVALAFIQHLEQPARTQPTQQGTRTRTDERAR